MNEQAIKALDALAIKLGATGELLFGYLVKHEYIDAWVSLAQMAVLVAVCWGLAKWDLHDADDPSFASGCRWCAVFTFGFLALLLIPDVVQGFINPEGEAVIRVMRGR